MIGGAVMLMDKGAFETKETPDDLLIDFNPVQDIKAIEQEYVDQDSPIVEESLGRF